MQLATCPKTVQSLLLMWYRCDILSIFSYYKDMKRNAMAAIGRSKCMQSGKGENEAKKRKKRILGRINKVFL
jgi:hypothetical protein